MSCVVCDVFSDLSLSEANYTIASSQLNASGDSFVVFAKIIPAIEFSELCVEDVTFRLILFLLLYS